MIVFHVTPARNMPAIRQYGLVPRDSTAPNEYGNGWGRENMGVRAVFVHGTFSAAFAWERYRSSRYSKENLVVLAVDATDLEWDGDPYGGLRILESVPPESIYLVTPLAEASYSVAA